MKQDKLDWAKIHKKIEDTRAAIERGWEPTAAEKKSVLAARAKALAKKPKEIVATEQIEALEFFLSGEKYGIESAFVSEVYHLRNFIQLPNTPSFVFGVINVRGRIVPLIDLRDIFGMSKEEINPLSRAVILGIKEVEYGIICDAIIGTETILPEAIHAVPPTITGMRAEYLKGVTKEQMAFLDGKKLISDTRLVVHEEV